MRKLIACLPTLMTTALNGLMCWGINQLPGKDDLPIPRELFFWLTVSSVLGIAFFTTQSSGSQTTSETTNRSWVIGLPPVMGSFVLFALLKGGHLPSELAQYAGYASLLLFVMGTLLPALRAFWETRQSNTVIPATVTGINQQDYKNRQALLNKVKNYWVKGVLDGSLSNRARIELELEERFDAVQLDWQTPEQPRRSLPKGTKAINQFDKMGKGCTLLILGAPGAGKTTTLLEITSELIARAEQDINFPIPVVFNLSSWAATKKQTITEWLVEELDSRYQIPLKVGSNWIKNEGLLLLLDGLDEVSEERRNDCVIAINNFKQSHGITQMIVCSRIKDYEALSNRFQFQGAIFIEDLALEQINVYFDKAGNKLQGVKVAWINDDVLQELTKTPLMLSVIAIAYEGIVVAELPKMDLKQRRKHLFNKYIEKMLAHRKHSLKYSNESTIRWLASLAKVMQIESQTVFLIERMQPIWMSQRERTTYEMIIILIFLLMALIFIKVLNPGVVASTILLVILSFIGFCLATQSNIKPKFITSFSLKKAGLSLSKSDLLPLLRGLSTLIAIETITGILGFLLARYVAQDKSVSLLYVILVIGYSTVLVTIILILFAVFVVSFLEVKELVTEVIAKPNQGIWMCLINGFFLTFFYILMLGLLFVLSGSSLYWSTIIGISFGICSPSGIACIQHFIMRIVLCKRGKIPWNYARFLDYATERIFLQKVGGGYIFIHRLLLEHFASL